MADWTPPTQDRVEAYFKELNNWAAECSIPVRRDDAVDPASTPVAWRRKF